MSDGNIRNFKWFGFDSVYGDTITCSLDGQDVEELCIHTDLGDGGLVVISRAEAARIIDWMVNVAGVEWPTVGGS